jgi:hypothetical protein
MLGVDPLAVSGERDVAAHLTSRITRLRRSHNGRYCRRNGYRSPSAHVRPPSRPDASAGASNILPRRRASVAFSFIKGTVGSLSAQRVTLAGAAQWPTICRPARRPGCQRVEALDHDRQSGLGLKAQREAVNARSDYCARSPPRAARTPIDPLPRMYGLHRPRRKAAGALF